MMKIFEKFGLVLPDDRVLKFRLEYELDPKDMSLVRLNETETVARKTWLSPNEQREEDPSGPKGPISGGDKLPMEQPFGMDPGAQQPRSPGVDSEPIEVDKEVLNPKRFTDEMKQNIVKYVDSCRPELSVTKAIKRLQERYDVDVSERSYYNWREKFDS